MIYKNLLIRGKPRSGKTTLIMRVIDALKDIKIIGGFYTQEIRKDRKRVGFVAKTIDGRQQTLAHMDIISGLRVGKYGVDIQSIDGIIVDSIEDAIKDREIIIIDEIGKMELFSEKFKDAVLRALDSTKTVVATIPVYNSDFIDNLKERRDVRIFNLNIKNRQILFDEVLRTLKKRIL